MTQQKKKIDVYLFLKIIITFKAIINELYHIFIELGFYFQSCSLMLNYMCIKNIYFCDENIR